MNRLKNLSKKNSFRFLAVLYLIDFSWLFLMYIIGEGRDLNFNSIESNTILFAGLQTVSSIAASYFIVNQINTNANWIKLNRGIALKIVYISIVFNILNFYFNQYYSRYQASQLTGVFGIYYMMSLGLNIAAFSLLIRMNFNDKRIKSLMILHVFSMFGRVDGIAETVVLISMMYIYVVVCKVNMKIMGLLLLIFSSVVVLYGIEIKLGENFASDYLIEYMPMWTVERLAIHSYQWGEVLNGTSIIKDLSDFILISWNSFFLRFDLLCGCNLGQSSIPKSVSEAMYYDLYGLYGSGSSPGVMTSISLMGPLGLIAICWNGIISKLIFSNIEFNFSYFSMIALSVVYKILYVDISEYLAIISPVVLIFIIVLLISCIKVGNSQQNIKHSL